MAAATHSPGSRKPVKTDSNSTLRDTAAEIGSSAERQVRHHAETAQRRTSESMQTFAEAIRHAGDELAGKDEGPAAQLLAQAAGGLEQLSNAISGKRVEEIVADVRRFGREHPGAFMMGSVLLGVALGRFAQTAVAGSSASEGSSAHAAPMNESAPASGYVEAMGGNDEF